MSKSAHLHEYNAVDHDAVAQALSARPPGRLDGLRRRPLHRQVQARAETAEMFLDDQRSLQDPILRSANLGRTFNRTCQMPTSHDGCMKGQCGSMLPSMCGLQWTRCSRVSKRKMGLHLAPPKRFADAVAAEAGLDGNRGGALDGELPPCNCTPRRRLQADDGSARCQERAPLYGASPQRLRRDHRPAQVRCTPADRQRAQSAFRSTEHLYYNVKHSPGSPRVANGVRVVSVCDDTDVKLRDKIHQYGCTKPQGMCSCHTKNKYRNAPTVNQLPVAGQRGCEVAWRQQRIESAPPVSVAAEYRL